MGLALHRLLWSPYGRRPCICLLQLVLREMWTSFQNWASGTQWCGSGTSMSTACPVASSDNGDMACFRHDHGKKHNGIIGGFAAAYGTDDLVTAFDRMSVQRPSTCGSEAVQSIKRGDEAFDQRHLHTHFNQDVSRHDVAASELLGGCLSDIVAGRGSARTS